MPTNNLRRSEMGKDMNRLGRGWGSWLGKEGADITLMEALSPFSVFLFFVTLVMVDDIGPRSR